MAFSAEDVSTRPNPLSGRRTHPPLTTVIVEGAAASAARGPPARAPEAAAAMMRAKTANLVPGMRCDLTMRTGAGGVLASAYQYACPTDHDLSQCNPTAQAGSTSPASVRRPPAAGGSAVGYNDKRRGREMPEGARPMTMRFRIAMAQINTIVGDFEGNTRKIVERIEEAEGLGADLVSFPELAVTGYPPEDLLIKTDFIAENLACVDEIARRIRSTAAVVGFVDSGDHLYNAAAVLAGGRVAGVYRKTRLPNYGVFDEKRYFQPGADAPVFVVHGVPVGVNICEDVWAPGGPLLAQALAGALISVTLNSSPYSVQKWRLRDDMLRTRARDYAIAIAYNNLVGGQDELVFDGLSVAADASGRVLARGPAFEEALILVDVDVDAIRSLRRYNSLRTPDALHSEGLPAPIFTVSPDPAPGAADRPPLPPAAPADPPDELEEVYRALVVGTRDYVRKNRMRTVVLGLSGGVDSSLVACIAVDALGRESVRGVMLPSRYTSEDSRRYARALAGALGIELLDLPIDPAVGAYERILAAPFAGRPADETEENLQARARGNLLMALSNKLGWLVLTTGNKSEMSVGYATLYGDMAGGFAVIKDVPKTLVYRLARWRNARDPRPVIPDGVLTRAPTAELRANQTDQDSLPPYEILDPILRLYVEDDRSAEEIAAMGFDPATVARVIMMVDRSEYKRRQAPPGLKITPKAFGKDRRLPITNWYRGRSPQALDARHLTKS
jgi:NAD+ synthase (glutamine-hydrolysing)